MKFASWNVNGLRACLKKNFIGSFHKIDADIFAVQEVRMQSGQAIIDFDGREQIWNCGERKGYAGTAVFTRVKPENFTLGIGDDEFDAEGRTITLDLGEIFFVCAYVPNSHNLEWLERRLRWEKIFREHLTKLDAVKPVVVCGDFNVAHQPIDLKHPERNHQSAGFSDAERAEVSALLNAGFVDTFRFLHPTATDAYTWWNYRSRARQNNSGWRIDYFLVSERLRYKISAATIESEILGSDHCPVTLELVVSS